MHTCSPSWISLQLRPRSHPFRLLQNSGLRSVCYAATSRWLPILHMECICFSAAAAAAAAKSLQSCPTLCDPIDGSPPGSPVPGILQANWGRVPLVLLFSVCPTLSFPHCVHRSGPHVGSLDRPCRNKFICTIFLFHICVCVCVYANTYTLVHEIYLSLPRTVFF